MNANTMNGKLGLISLTILIYAYPGAMNDITVDDKSVLNNA